MKRALAFLLILALGGCPDPIRDQIEAEQGPEHAGVREGPLHRPGERCLACHYEGGEADPAFSVAGTIFQREGESTPAPGTEIAVRDANGKERTFVANEAGNFYVSKDDWAPRFPIKIELHANGRTITMLTESPREGSCGACHVAAGDQRHMPAVYLEAAK